ncbi:superoxide dismutase family protein [Sciscionella sediminilitoris]|uniref:superoxide dismutase family protein n=1 Tax=Sciscionella sediminilitoris TaxID=1445613 RepID=UPI0004DF3B1F|nr:superoxide dismutase family protein [Sciscionella sp. SE31]
MPSRNRKKILFVAVLIAAGFGTSGLASAQPVPDTAAAAGVFGAYAPGRAASTYDPALVPPGSSAGAARFAPGTGGTTVVFGVRGLVPDRAYGAHVHTKACGATGEAAGPHFQNVPDPVQPSVDPAYANPRNEVWLDFTTDATGTGFAASSLDWRFAGRAAKSIVIHETPTHTGAGHAGMAGARLACLNIGL